MKPLKGIPAENVLNRILQAAGWSVHQARRTGTKRGGKYITFSNDLWGCVDLACVRKNAGVWFIQVTTSSGITPRRRKLEAIAWPLSSGAYVFRVSIFETRVELDPANPRRARHWFRIHDLLEDGKWSVGWRLEVPREMLRPPKKNAQSPEEADDEQAE